MGTTIWSMTENGNLQRAVCYLESIQKWWKMELFCEKNQ